MRPTLPMPKTPRKLPPNIGCSFPQWLEGRSGGPALFRVRRFSRQGDIALWIGGATLVPLFLLLLSGLYMFILPHIRRWQGRATSRGGAT